MSRIFLIAGESSGDRHGAHLIRALREADPEVQCEGLGGPEMAAAGMDLRFDLASHAVMGFTEIVRHFPMIRRLFHETLGYLETHPPDVLVLIDYPGFNIRLAKRAHALGIRVAYYISPQVWAWKKNRIHTLARCVDRMLVIFPFEEALYREAGLDCVYVGHPLLDRSAPEHPANEACTEWIIGLLPGSREQEIRRLMGVMIETARGILKEYPEASFMTPCVNADRAAQVRSLAGDFPLEIHIGGMDEILSKARFCLVASGTATLETALAGVPMIILYRVSPLSYWLARALVDIQHIGIVNILAGRGIVPEFIQGEAQAANVLPKALELIGDTRARAAMLEHLAEIRARLGGAGASARAAAEILNLAKGLPHG